MPEIRNNRRNVQDKQRLAKASRILGVQTKWHNPPVGFKSTSSLITLVRHGETLWNAERRLQGQLDVPLNQTGVLQAQEVAEHFRSSGDPVNAVYSSDLTRTKDTAECVAAALGGLTVHVDPGLRERCLGDQLQGLTMKEAQLQKPSAVAVLRNRDLNAKLPGGGESQMDVFKRVSEAVEKIATDHKGENVIIVTHGGVINHVYQLATGTHSSVSIVNGGLYLIRVFPGHDSWQIENWGDCGHLQFVSVQKDAFGGTIDSG
mmetsp:Transcript_32065/g.44452  ORF Transcript_32065/g.44452 Transcript_32065/m.44452 type:complete len:261 (+) Transcript_32065:213-995(+)|eukprot:CAMPEP_0196585716 /NCGR_PEP_ID=MMETSP1081-20130531/51720_1 /TAXON_ID=36882 /ORGANISM="Pyramimonas amylifera, Strain CCMP720" /LENGTH=260 /DNA_ID=CAMNT_0041907351 /DNA_START=207 /DNA_END=989 /DNA_ORIENTATION=+